MKIRAGELDGRNIGSRATIVVEDATYHGIIASLKKTDGDPENGVPGKVRILFTDNETNLTVGKQHTVDIHLAGWELSVMDIHREVQVLVDKLTP